MDQNAVAALMRPKCRVCSSPLREQVDLRLMGREVRDDDGERYSYDEIVDWAAAHGLTLSKAGLSRHKSEHLMPDLMGAIEAQRTVEAIAAATGQTMGLETAFLQIFINKAMRKLADGELADDGKWLGTSVRAVEALLKVRKAELALTRDKIAEADKKVTALAQKNGMDPDVLATIRRDLYGLVDAEPEPVGP